MMRQQSGRNELVSRFKEVAAPRGGYFLLRGDGRARRKEHRLLLAQLQECPRSQAIKPNRRCGEEIAMSKEIRFIS
jgi:hypothetical protein